MEEYFALHFMEINWLISKTEENRLLSFLLCESGAYEAEIGGDHPTFILIFAVDVSK